MKCEISEKGCLNIIPETDLEAYALKKWWEDFENHVTIPETGCKIIIYGKPVKE